MDSETQRDGVRREDDGEEEITVAIACDEAWRVQYLSYLRAPLRAAKPLHDLTDDEFLELWSEQMEREARIADDDESTVLRQLQALEDHCTDVTSRPLQSEALRKGVSGVPPLDGPYNSQNNVSTTKARENRRVSFKYSSIWDELDDDDVNLLTDDDRRQLEMKWSEEEEHERNQAVEDNRRAEEEHSMQCKQDWREVRESVSLLKQKISASPTKTSHGMLSEGPVIKFCTPRELEELDRLREAECQRILELELASECYAHNTPAAEVRVQQEVLVASSPGGPSPSQYFDAETNRMEEYLSQFGMSTRDATALSQSAPRDTRKSRRCRHELSLPVEAKERILMHREDVASAYSISQAKERIERCRTELSKVESDVRYDVVRAESRLWSATVSREHLERKALQEMLEHRAQMQRKARVDLLKEEDQNRSLFIDAEGSARLALQCEETQSLATAERLESARLLSERQRLWAEEMDKVKTRNNDLYRNVFINALTVPTTLSGDVSPVHIRDLASRSRGVVLTSQKKLLLEWQGEVTSMRPPSATIASRRSSVGSCIDKGSVTDSGKVAEDEFPNGCAASEGVLTSEYVRRHCQANSLHDGVVSITMENLVSVTNLASCTFLRELNCEGNAIHSVHPALFLLPHLTKLNLKNNHIATLTAPPNGGSSSLTEIDVSINQLSNLHFCAALPKLTNLIAQCNNISDLTGLENSPALTNLDLYRNSVASIQSLACLNRLARLNLGRNSLTSIDNLGKWCPLLVDLTLYYNKIDRLPTDFKGLVLLQHLYLNNNNLSELPSGAIFHPSLTRLNVSGNGVTEVDTIAQRLLMLEYLDISFNKISSETAVLALWSLRRLRSLNVGNNPCHTPQTAAGIRSALLNLFSNLTEYNNEAVDDRHDMRFRDSYVPQTWFMEVEYDYMCSLQVHHKINWDDPVAKLLDMYTAHRVFAPGSSTHVVRDTSAAFKVRGQQHSTAILKRRVAAWLSRCIRKSKYTKAALIIQPRWKGAVVRERLRRHRMQADDIDLDEFKRIELEDCYTTDNVHDVTSTAVGIVTLLSSALGTSGPSVVPHPTRPIDNTTQHAYAPPPMLTSVPSVTRQTGAPYSVKVDSWLREQDDCVVTTARLAPPSSCDSPQRGAIPAAQTTSGEPDGWNDVMHMFRKRNENMNRKKQQRVIKDTLLHDATKRLEQFRRVTHAAWEPQVKQPARASVVVEKDCEVTSVGSSSSVARSHVRKGSSTSLTEFGGAGNLRRSQSLTKSGVPVTKW